MRRLYINKASPLPQIWTIEDPVNERKRAFSALATLVFSVFLLSCGKLQDPTSRPSPLVSDTLKSQGLMVSITYSSPRVRARNIWNDLVPLNKVWRTGANEATIFESSQDLLLDGKKLPQGKYAVFTIPGEEYWSIIFSRDWDQWGAYGYDESEDQLRLTVKPRNDFTHQEEMTFKVKEKSIQFRWENLGYDIAFQAN